ncbi:MAG: Rieske 2Fe-2S domain-containing protein [Burkholderiales bacterium]
MKQEENELLTRVGAGTPMGELFRQYWLPALTREDLPDAGGDPMRIRLLGENLIAFRDSQGKVGLVSEFCPHRTASLFFARNEQEPGLRCVYHGWKFDRHGNCLETPNERPESTLKSRIRIAAYPCAERNNIIWTYMGPLASPPPLPDIEWSLVPPEQAHITKRIQECNWAQALEGALDSSHGSFLHALNDGDVYSGSMHARGYNYLLKDRHPWFEVEDTDCGVMMAARRDAEEDSYYWRITQFLMPCHAVIPPYGPNPVFNAQTLVPMDDENSICWAITYHPQRALTEKDRWSPSRAYEMLGGGLHVRPERMLPKSPEAGGAWRVAANKTNNYLFDAKAQRTTRFSGLPGVAMQDAAIQESMGGIANRSLEHLGLADAGIVRFRRRCTQAALGLSERGTVPPEALKSASYRVRSASVVLNRGVNWIDGARDWLVIQPGRLLDAA